MNHPKREPHPNTQLVPEGKRPCPICGSSMYTETHLGLSIDACDRHGVWLDKGELEKIVSRAKRTTRRACRIAAKEAKTRGKYEGIFFGWLSLLWK